MFFILSFCYSLCFLSFFEIFFNLFTFPFSSSFPFLLFFPSILIFSFYILSLGNYSGYFFFSFTSPGSCNHKKNLLDGLKGWTLLSSQCHYRLDTKLYLLRNIYKTIDQWSVPNRTFIYLGQVWGYSGKSRKNLEKTSFKALFLVLQNLVLQVKSRIKISCW